MSKVEGCETTKGRKGNPTEKSRKRRSGKTTPMMHNYKEPLPEYRCIRVHHMREGSSNGNDHRSPVDVDTHRLGLVREFICGPIDGGPKVEVNP